MAKFIKNDEDHKIIQFEEQYELSDPKQWSYLDSVEGRESVSYTLTIIEKILMIKVIWWSQGGSNP